MKYVDVIEILKKKLQIFDCANFRNKIYISATATGDRIILTVCLIEHLPWGHGEKAIKKPMICRPFQLDHVAGFPSPQRVICPGAVVEILAAVKNGLSKLQWVDLVHFVVPIDCILPSG